MMATLPPDEETACAFFMEWRTEVYALNVFEGQAEID